jgi:bifunctional DNA-binding transcriptional regulator/antitoxin component of YhaV-PrlF toxin-antitoxin module
MWRVKEMPRLVKGGKHVYGWSEVGSEGRIVVPNEARIEYNFKTPINVILIPGSRRSGGFAVTTLFLLKNSPLAVLLDDNPRLAGFRLPEGEAVKVAGKPCCWVTLNTDGSIVVPLETLKLYGVNAGDLLLSVRGSRLALAFCAKGPLIAEARKHLGLAVCSDERVCSFCVKSISV